MIAAIKGYAIELVMPENSTAERIATMEAFGAKVTLTPADAGIEGAIDYTRAKLAQGGVIMLNQLAIPTTGAPTTAPPDRVWRTPKGRSLILFRPWEPPGPLWGPPATLKEQNPAVQIVGVRPTDGARIPGIRRWPEEYVPAIFEPSRVDVTLDVSQEEAEEMARCLPRREGIFAGVSSGGACAAACRLAATLESGVRIHSCDQGDRYLSSNLFTYSSRSS